MSNILFIILIVSNIYSIKTFDISDEESVPRVRQLNRDNQTATIELGLFYEQSLEHKFNNNITALNQYIRTLLSGVQDQLNLPSLETNMQLVVTKYTRVTPEMLKPVQNSSVYLNNFCDWQSKNYRRQEYDLGLFLINTDIRDDNKPIDGRAKMGLICRSRKKQRNCLIVRISYVKSVFSLVHEMMHTLGVREVEDWKGKCDGEGIMNGVRKNVYKWTNCTNISLKTFLANNAKSYCLYKNNGNPLIGWNLNETEFNLYSRDDQCALDFGKMYKAINRKYHHICKQLVCGYDFFGYISSFDPPIERTVCFNNPLKICMTGDCVDPSTVIPIY